MSHHGFLRLPSVEPQVEMSRSLRPVVWRAVLCDRSKDQAPISLALVPACDQDAAADDPGYAWVVDCGDGVCIEDSSNERCLRG